MGRLDRGSTQIPFKWGYPRFAASVVAGTGAGAGTLLAGAAIGAAVGSVASQGLGMVTGLQDKFSWNAVALSAISAGVSRGVSGALGKVSGNAFIDGAVRQGVSNAATQGIAVATGLQSKFDWTGVAVGAVVGGVSNAVGQMTPFRATGSYQPNAFMQAIPGAAGGIAGAAARSLITGTDFGDNVRAVLPDVIGATIGNAIAGKIQDSIVARAEAAQNTWKAPSSAQEMWQEQTNAAAEIAGQNPYSYGDVKAPAFVAVENLSTLRGEGALGRFTLGARPGDAPYIAIDADLLRQAQTSPYAAGQLYNVAQEELGEAAASLVGLEFLSEGRRLDAGAILGSIVSDASIEHWSRTGEKVNFSLDIGGVSRSYATTVNNLRTTYNAAFTIDRIYANVEDAGGSYQRLANDAARSRPPTITVQPNGAVSYNSANRYAADQLNTTNAANRAASPNYPGYPSVGGARPGDAQRAQDDYARWQANDAVRRGVSLARDQPGARYLDPATGKFREPVTINLLPPIRLPADRAAAAESEVAQITLNAARGRAFEEAGIRGILRHIGQGKNTTAVTRNGVTTILDASGRPAGLVEFKNVVNLSSSPQLRAQLAEALATRQPYNLVVSPGTQSISKPLLRQIERVNQQVGGGVYRYDPATDTLTPFGK